MLSYPMRDAVTASPRDAASLSTRVSLAVILGLSLSLWAALATLALPLL